MIPLRVLIVDDEPLARRGLQALCRRCPDVVVVAEAANGRDAEKCLRELQVDLVFLDVQMQGMTGFDMIRGVGPSRIPLIVFVTAHDQYALSAFDVAAVDYLTKPVLEERFRRALARAREALGRRHPPAPASDPPLVQRIVFQTGYRNVALEPADVDWVSVDDCYATVYARGRRYIIVEPLCSLERRLTPGMFVRAHRSALVNVARIREVQVDVRPARLLLADGTRVLLSRRQRGAVIAAVRRLGQDARSER